MRLSRTAWIVLGIGIFVIAAVSLYLLYGNQTRAHQAAKDELDEVQATAPLLLLEKQALQNELAQKEDELAQWNDTISRLEGQLAQAEIELGQTQDGFHSSAESIEYDEILFVFAHNSNLEISILNASETNDADVEGIGYKTTVFAVEVRGEVANILDFVNTIVTDEAFKTAILEPVDIMVPEPLTEEDKEQILEDMTAEEIESLIEEAVETLPGQERLTPEDIDNIVVEIGSLIGFLEGLTEEEIAELTASEIESLIVGAMGGLVEEITAEDIAELIGKLEGIIGELEGAIGDNIEERAAEMIEELEMPSANITLNIYTYEGE